MPPGPRLVEPPVLTEAHEDLGRSVREVCSCFPNEYWRDLDERRRYPEEFVVAMTDADYLGALIPEEYGGMGLDLSAGCAILEEVEKRSSGLSVFFMDLREAEGLTVRPRRVMMNNATSELVFEGVRLPVEAMIGDEGKGFRYIIDGMNAERILIAAECVGDGRWFIEKATERAGERKFREMRLYQVAPISTNLILSYIAEHVLGLPRSF
jgi:alkylation response protein AidB-like acyl-CoA dehydrogenase